MTILGSVNLFDPASRTRTLTLGSSVNRVATTSPDVPPSSSQYSILDTKYTAVVESCEPQECVIPPTITKSKASVSRKPVASGSTMADDIKADSSICKAQGMGASRLLEGRNCRYICI